MKVVAAVLLLAATLGCANVTAFAPDDLASTLPREVNGKTLDVSSPTADQLADTDNFENLRPLMAREGKGPTDLLAARARFVETSGSPEGFESLDIVALRVRGIPAERLVAELFRPPPSLMAVTIADREVLRDANQPAIASVLYPKGEVLYAVSAVTRDSQGDLRAALRALP